MARAGTDWLPGPATRPRVITKARQANAGEVAMAMSAAASANAERSAPPVPAVREVQQNESFR